MTICLEITEIDVQQVHKRESYKEDGLYLVNEGVAWLLVSVSGTNVYTIPIANKNIATQYENLGRSKAARDIHGIVENRLNYIVDMLEKQKDIKPLYVEQNSSSNLEEVTRLVQAVNAPFISIVNKTK